METGFGFMILTIFFLVIRGTLNEKVSIDEQRKNKNVKVPAQNVDEVIQTKLLDEKRQGKYTENNSSTKSGHTQICKLMDSTNKQSQLERFIELQQIIKIHYRNNAGISSERIIKPLSFSLWGRTKCVDAFCHKRNAIRTFAVEKIELIEVYSLTANQKQDKVVNNKVNRQEVLFKENKLIKDNSIQQFFTDINVKVIDKSLVGGAVWFIVNSKNELKFKKKCEELGLKPKYTKKGSKTSRYKPAYYINRAA